MTRGPAGRPGTARLVAAGAVANLAVGTLFAWSLVAPRVVADAGAPRGSGPAVFALALGVFTVVLLGVGRWLARVGPRRLLAAAALAAGSGRRFRGHGRGARRLGQDVTQTGPRSRRCGP